MVISIDAVLFLNGLTLITSCALFFCGKKEKQNKCPVRPVTQSMRVAPMSDAMTDSTRTAMDTSEKKKKKQGVEEKGSRKSRKKKKKKTDVSQRASRKNKKSEKKGLKSLLSRSRVPEASTQQDMSNERIRKQKAPSARPGQPTSQPLSHNPRSGVTPSAQPLTAKTAPSIKSLPPNTNNPAVPSPAATPVTEVKPSPDAAGTPRSAAVMNGAETKATNSMPAF
ncbi:unnamed protein product [Caenorhabditis sp. 36 PRJEB53466]|nr:unnamed protein product [Caenorhabditis sp. 36 PRJEB53466]